jgi:hypothetical protein
MQDHAPYGHAFNELALMVFIELLDEAARYLEAFDRIDDPCVSVGDSDEEEDGYEAEGDKDCQAAEEEADTEPADTGERPVWERTLDLALAAGFMLRVKADGWKLFCERLTIPSFVLWKILLGYDRLQRALPLAEKAAFVPEGMVRWLNSIRADGAPEAIVDELISAEKVADTLEVMFRRRVEWWGGRPACL